MPRRGFEVKVTVGEVCFRWHGMWRFVSSGKDYERSRAFVGIGVERGNHNYGALLQLWRPGSSLDMHADGPKSVETLWFLLRRARRGGELVVQGPCRRWFWGRVRAFNAADLHEVELVERGHRVTLMLQKARWR